MTNAEQITAIAAVIRDVDGAHTLGAAALAEALVDRGVRIPGPTEWLYAAAAVADADGMVHPVSAPFPTAAEAEQELATLLGDDYYRDRRPFIATTPRQLWNPVADTATSHG